MAMSAPVDTLHSPLVFLTVGRDTVVGTQDAAISLQLR